jgi:hypothetical protein
MAGQQVDPEAQKWLEQQHALQRPGSPSTPDPWANCIAGTKQPKASRQLIAFLASGKCPIWHWQGDFDDLSGAVS